MVFWFPSRSTQGFTRHTTISSLDLAFLPGIELTVQSENKYISYHIESMLLILSCTFRLGYDTSIVASKVGRIMSYNFVYHIICWLVPPKSTEQVPPKREKWPLVPPNTPRINKLLTDSAQVWNWLTKLPEPFFSIKWIQLHTWAEPVKPDDKALLKSHSEFYNVGEYMTIKRNRIDLRLRA